MNVVRDIALLQVAHRDPEIALQEQRLFIDDEWHDDGDERFS